MTTKAKKDYSKGKIYKIEPICDYEEGEIYIGSTTKDYLSQRMVQHRWYTYKQWKEANTNLITSFILFDKYGIDSFNIVLLESVDANNYDELVAREAYYIRNLKCVNKVIPDRIKKEYLEEWRKDNREDIIKYHQAYYINKREILLDREKKYAEANKAKISERRKTKYECECGSLCRKVGRSAHYKTSKHQEYLKSTNQII